MVRLSFLGGAIVEDESGVVAGFASRRHPLAILALLSTAASRTLSRSKLIGLLWPDAPEEKGRNRLNTYVHQIRSALGDELLLSVGDDLRLDPDAVDCDICRFEEAIEAGDRETAVELYSGPFLDGFALGGSPDFEHHVDRERTRLRRRYREALETLAEAAEEREDFDAAARWWRKRTNDDPYDSGVTGRLMETLARSGNPAAALRVARVHAQLLEGEFGTEPSQEVRELERDLRAGSHRSAEAPSSLPPANDRSSVKDPAVGATERTTAPPAEPRPVRAAGTRLGQRTLLATLVAIGLLGAAAVGGWYLLGAGGSSPIGVHARAIAVLPFEDLGAEEDDTSVFAEGLHSDVSTRLAGVSGLDVISRGSVRRFRDTRTPLREIGRALGAAWVLEGDVQRAGDEVRLNARLVDAREDRQVWSESYRRAWTAENLFEIQGEIAQEIVRALEIELTPAERRRLQEVPTESTAAYELYLQARDLDRTPTAVGSNDRKVELYRRALELDSAFADAWAWLADALVERAWMSGDTAWTDSATVAVRQALDLNPTLADAYAQLGDIHWTASRMEEAIGAYERALDLQPSNEAALNNLSVLLGRRGRYAEKMRLKDRTRRLAPDSPGPIQGLALLNSELGRDDVAAAWLEVGRERGHSLPWLRFYVSLFHRRDLAGAREALRELAEDGDDYRFTRRAAALALYEGDWRAARRHYRILYPGVDRATTPVFKALLWDPLGLAYALERLGDQEEAREIAAEVVPKSERELRTDPDHLSRHRLAVAHLMLGDTAAALDWLERSVDVGYRGVRLMRTIPVLDPLRDHPRFQGLLERMEILLDQERRRIEAEGWGVPPE